MQIPRYPLAITALVAVLASVSACGPDDAAPQAAPQESASPSGSPSSAQESELASLVDTVGESTADTGGNYTGEETSTALGDEADVPVPSATHTFEMQGSDEASRITSYLPGTGELMMEMLRDEGADVSGLDADRMSTTVVIRPADGGPLLASNETGRFPVDAAWVSGAYTESNVPTGPSLTLSGVAPLYAGLVAAEAVSLKGTREYDGFTATLVEGELTEADIADLDDDARATVENLLDGPPEGMVDIALWIGEDDMPLRMEASDNKAETVLVFYDFGSTSFQVPDPDDVRRL